MSASGEIFAAPDRPPDITPARHVYNPAAAVSDGCIENIWFPSGDTLGQQRWVATADIGTDTLIHRGHHLHIEALAAAGMRNIFERFGLRSFHHAAKDTSTYPRPVEVHNAAIAFPSSEYQRQLVDRHAAAAPHRQERYTIATYPSGKFTGVQQIGELAQKRLIMCQEDPHDLHDDGRYYYLGYYMHDLTIHFPAWLCLPPIISTGLQERAAKLHKDYMYGKETGSYYLTESAEQQMARMTGLIDGLVTVWTMNKLINGGADTYGDQMSELLQWNASGSYRNLTIEQIEKPREEEVLVARWVI